MPQIEVVSGFAEDVFDNGAGVSFKLGSPAIALAIGAIPRRDPLGVLGSQPVVPKEWLAVAVRRSNFSGTGYVLLAFRRLGLRGDAQAANFTAAAWLLALSIGGVAASFLADDFEHRVGYAACFLALAIPCMLRLLSVRKATRLLQAWMAPA